MLVDHLGGPTVTVSPGAGQQPRLMASLLSEATCDPMHSSSCSFPCVCPAARLLRCGPVRTSSCSSPCVCPASSRVLEDLQKLRSPQGRAQACPGRVARRVHLTCLRLHCTSIEHMSSPPSATRARVWSTHSQMVLTKAVRKHGCSKLRAEPVWAAEDGSDQSVAKKWRGVKSTQCLNGHFMF